MIGCRRLARSELRAGAGRLFHFVFHGRRCIVLHGHRRKTQQASIARLEAGGRDPSVSYLRRVAAALDCRLEIRLVPQGEEAGSPCVGDSRAQA